MSLIMSEPDSKLPENPSVSSSFYESPSKTAVTSNGKDDSPATILTELRGMNENGLAQNGSKSSSSSSTPPPLEPIPSSFFPGESAKIYSGMPQLTSSPSKQNVETSETIPNGELSPKLPGPYAPNDQSSMDQALSSHSNGHTVPSPQLMPPPLTNMMKARPTNFVHNVSNRYFQNGHFKPRIPDSSHDIYASPPGPSRYPYHGHSDYPHQQPYINTNGNSQHYKYGKGPLRVTMPTSTAEQVHLVNGEIHHPQHIPQQRTSSTNIEDNGEIINVDEDVDLERMYLDLITEEYTATVKR